MPPALSLSRGSTPVTCRAEHSRPRSWGPQPKVFTVWLRSWLTIDIDQKMMKDQVTSSRSKATSVSFTHQVQLCTDSADRAVQVQGRPWWGWEETTGDLGPRDLKKQVLCHLGPMHLCPPGAGRVAGDQNEPQWVSHPSPAGCFFHSCTPPPPPHKEGPRESPTLHLEVDHFIDTLHDPVQHCGDIGHRHQLRQAQQQPRHRGRSVPTGRVQVVDGGLHRLQGTGDL